MRRRNQELEKWQIYQDITTKIWDTCESRFLNLSEKHSMLREKFAAKKDLFLRLLAENDIAKTSDLEEVTAFVRTSGDKPNLVPTFLKVIFACLITLFFFYIIEVWVLVVFIMMILGILTIIGLPILLVQLWQKRTKTKKDVAMIGNFFRHLHYLSESMVLNLDKEK